MRRISGVPKAKKAALYVFPLSASVVNLKRFWHQNTEEQLCKRDFFFLLLFSARMFSFSHFSTCLLHLLRDTIINNQQVLKVH